jgi:hypothetical protein
MWAVLGFLIAAAIGLVVVIAACDRGSVQRDKYPWILYDTAKSHVGIMAGLAFDPKRTSPSADSTTSKLPV